MRFKPASLLSVHDCEPAGSVFIVPPAQISWQKPNSIGIPLPRAAKWKPKSLSIKIITPWLLCATWFPAWIAASWLVFAERMVRARNKKAEPEPRKQQGTILGRRCD